MTRTRSLWSTWLGVACSQEASSRSTRGPLPPRNETVDDALMELIYDHPVFEESFVEVRELSCTEVESTEFSGGAEIATVPIEESAAEIASDGDELDRYDTGVYLCRNRPVEEPVLYLVSPIGPHIGLGAVGGVNQPEYLKARLLTTRLTLFETQVLYRTGFQHGQLSKGAMPLD
jgi:hypothetical protein